MQNIRKFAQILFEEKDYNRAAGEYQRYLALSKYALDSALYKIAICYELDNQREKSIQFYNRLVKNYPQSSFANLSNYQIAANLFLVKHYEQSNNQIYRIIPKINSKQYQLIHDFQYLFGINLIFQKEWKNALNHFDKMEKFTTDHEIKSKYWQGKKFAEGRFKISRRSPLIVGALSTILPGLGKVYCNQTGDGIFSFIMFALAGYLSWDGFRDNGRNSVKGWTFGTIGGILYLGNIYGSSIAAKIYNNNKETEYLNGKNLEIKLYNEINF